MARLGLPALEWPVAAEHVILPGLQVQRLVMLSVLISILGAYAARDLIERIRDVRSRARLARLAGAAAVDGFGTWSMHCTRMAALTLPIPVLYDLPTGLLPLLVGVA